MPAEQATPGQAAAEAFWRVAGEGVALSEDDWNQWARSGSRRPWDAAADAVAAPLNAEIASLREQADRLRIADADLRRRLDDLASQWEHRGCVVALVGAAGCARELREALEGGSCAPMPAAVLERLREGVQDAMTREEGDG